MPDLFAGLTERQRAEIARYEGQYRNPDYAMGPVRRCAIAQLLSERQDLRRSLLDVATGRGEVLGIACRLGYGTFRGTEVVEELLSNLVVRAVAWNLPWPDRAFETVTCFDALEHFLPRDAEPTVRELARVAGRRILLTISNVESGHRDEHGDLHVNRRPYEDWDRDLRAWLTGWSVTWRRDVATSISEAWEAVRASDGSAIQTGTVTEGIS